MLILKCIEIYWRARGGSAWAEGCERRADSGPGGGVTLCTAVATPPARVWLGWEEVRDACRRARASVQRGASARR